MVLPASLRVLSQGAFSACGHLRTVQFGEGLETIGAQQYQADGYSHNGAFEHSAVEDVRLPQTLRRIERSAFGSCYNLKKIVLPEHLEYIAASCFNCSGLESVFLPPNVAQIQ